MDKFIVDEESLKELICNARWLTSDEIKLYSIADECYIKKNDDYFLEKEGKKEHILKEQFEPKKRVGSLVIKTTHLINLDGHVFSVDIYKKPQRNLTIISSKEESDYLKEHFNKLEDFSDKELCKFARVDKEGGFVASSSYDYFREVLKRSCEDINFALFQRVLFKFGSFLQESMREFLEDIDKESFILAKDKDTIDVVIKDKSHFYAKNDLSLKYFISEEIAKKSYNLSENLKENDLDNFLIGLAPLCEIFDEFGGIYYEKREQRLIEKLNRAFKKFLEIKSSDVEQLVKEFDIKDRIKQQQIEHKLDSLYLLLRNYK